MKADDLMYVRRTYLLFVKNESLTTTFRPGARINGAPKSYYSGEIVEIKILDKIGAEWAGLDPEFIKGFSRLVRIKKTQQIKLENLVEKDFIGSSPDVRNTDQLRFHLALIYNLDVRDLNDNFVVTRTEFDYIN